MEVVAFVGSSGTGKSHRALVVAHENKIECIIDDGILIHDNKIVAGFSAKKESSRLKAVRRAIFQDEVQVKSVREQLDKIKPNNGSNNSSNQDFNTGGISPGVRTRDELKLANEESPNKHLKV